ncbi:aspartic proteinase-like protein 1 [Primulina eburnea]|uniref:aspartic proteinase-like protein 1 n=1 Tax=Primulina eburnea TaxID=1245227 RepID=UPI003C6C6F16
MHHFAANLLLVSVFFFSVDAFAAKPIYSSRLIHRFSDEAQDLWASKYNKNGGNGTTNWAEKKSFRHMRMLLGNDLKRQRLRLDSQTQLLVASQGSRTFDYGNDLGWLHYTWIDIGTPNTSFLVALDAGSDLSWVPCDCVQCAPLTLSYDMLDTELSQYRPSHSSSSMSMPCSHELCEKGQSCPNPTGHCPYRVSYLSEDTSSSGFLFQDLLHLASVGGHKPQNATQATVIIGCGSKQSGIYLDGIAPGGLMGLGPGDISIPSMLAKSGLAPHSFSFCFDESYSGTLFFGDQGPESQRSTPFFISNGNNAAYIVQVENFCVSNFCVEQTEFKAQVDTGSSFTYLPSESYKYIVAEFDKRANVTKISTQGFDYCYESSSLKLPNFPSMKLIFATNQSFEIENPMLHIADDQGDLFCLGIHSIDGELGIIGQNFLMGYLMVFDWENMKLGWSSSNCQDIGNGSEIQWTPPSTETSQNPLPTNEQQQNPLAVAPAIAGRAFPKPSAASTLFTLHQYSIVNLHLLLWGMYLIYLV